jgi:hypothetical protein
MASTFGPAKPMPWPNPYQQPTSSSASLRKPGKPWKSGYVRPAPGRMDHRYLLENRQRWWRRLPKITSRCTSIDHGSPSTSMAGLIAHLDLDRR